MGRDTLVSALTGAVPKELAEDLVDAFLEMRRDVATGTLGRSAPGKFVESFVQVLQQLARSSYDARPSVDECLRNAESNMAAIDDGLRVCAARAARSMYTLRNRRNIAHKGAVDPNNYDLRFLLASAQWIMAELIRSQSGLSMEDAGKLIAAVSSPVGGLVEDVSGKRIVHANVSVREEILVLLHSFYPEPTLATDVVAHLDRRASGSVRNELRRMWQSKEAEFNGKMGYSLTKTGLQAAIAVIARETET